MPPEQKEIKRAGSLALGLFFLEDDWVIGLQLPLFPKDGISDGKELRAQPRVGLAWQKVASLFFGCSRGDDT